MEAVLILRQTTMQREDTLLVETLLASPWSGVRSVTLQWLVDRPTEEAAGLLLGHARRMTRHRTVSTAERDLLALALARSGAARYARRLFQARSRGLASPAAAHHGEPVGRTRI